MSDYKIPNNFEQIHMDFSLKSEMNWVCATHREATSCWQPLINEYFGDLRAKDKRNKE